MDCKILSGEELTKEAQLFIKNMPEGFTLTNPMQLYYGHKIHRYAWISTPPFKFDEKTMTRNRNGLFINLLKYARSLYAKLNINVVIYYESDMPPLFMGNDKSIEAVISMIPAYRLRAVTHATWKDKDWLEM